MKRVERFISYASIVCRGSSKAIFEMNLKLICVKRGSAARGIARFPPYQPPELQSNLLALTCKLHGETMADIFQTPSDYAVVVAQRRNRVLRNTYWLLALSMIPTVLGAWIGVASGFGRALTPGMG